MNVVGRWQGGEYVWPCPGCGCVRCSKQAPALDDAQCLRCRVGDHFTQIQALVDQLQGAHDEWMARARRAERIADDQCDEINALREEIAALKGQAA